MVTGAVSAAVTVAVAVAVTVLGLRDTRVVEVSYSGAVTVAVTDSVAATVVLAAAVSVALADTVAVAVAVTAAVALTVSVTVTVLRPNHTSRFLISQFNTRTCDDMCLVGSHILFQSVMLNTIVSSSKRFLLHFSCCGIARATPMSATPFSCFSSGPSGGSVDVASEDAVVISSTSDARGCLGQRGASGPAGGQRRASDAPVNVPLGIQWPETSVWRRLHKASLRWSRPY